MLAVSGASEMDGETPSCTHTVENTWKIILKIMWIFHDDHTTPSEHTVDSPQCQWSIISLKLLQAVMHCLHALPPQPGWTPPFVVHSEPRFQALAVGKMKMLTVLENNIFPARKPSNIEVYLATSCNPLEPLFEVLFLKCYVLFRGRYG